LASDGIFAFSIVPLRAATLLGVLATALSVLFAIFSVYAKFFLKRSPQGFTALVLLITFLAGILLFFMGIIGEYVGRLYEEVKARPLYVIGKTVGWPPPRSPETLTPEPAAQSPGTPGGSAPSQDGTP
jgi:dolichol-phosphate mannosyltransferase